ncbi:ABC transporter substrate-binding protein [Amycolatopsis endophytica]|uniref:Peptide/nickel transport system substrate-binding protein n=1 Tax=Amycolatopsis endophytica TaxID=860233 RepID=A0A853BAC5_9PSEU|nr:ABC transporter substrate-binding protein [Amycolatopsis endophytica]NYI91702.1 peptide/nickel transport system substrate-binding protein [Amycolatopsis endophytica]
MIRRSLLALLGVVALAVAGCAGGSSANEPGTLTVQFSGPPISGLDPAKSSGGQSMIYSTLAYDSLIFAKPDGTLAPDLATSWEWLDDAYRVFQLTLREGVVFSDGAPMTAEGVARWLHYYRDAKSTLSSNLQMMTSATAVDAHTVRIELNEPHPDLPWVLSQLYGGGMVANPSAMTRPGSLDMATNGTGPYVLDPGQSVSGDHYTYVRNARYWNPSVVYYDKVVIKAISDPNTVVSAVASGQIDVASGKPLTAPTAEDSGATVTSAPGAVWALYLLDRAGTLAPPLAKTEVRQAINLAIDRGPITKALNPNGYAVPTAQMGLPQQEGFRPELDTYYPYDPARARDLLARAGYPDGFRFTVLCSNTLSTCPLAQAVASSLGDIGITVDIDAENEISSFNQKFRGGKAPAVIFSNQTTAFMAARALSHRDVLANPFNSSDPRVSADYDRVAASSGDQQGAAYADLVRDFADLGWFAPVYRTETILFSSGVDNVALKPKAPTYYTAVDPTGTASWRPAS